MIYLVEDDEGIRELVVYTLLNTGFEAKGFRNSDEFWQAVEERIPSLVLLDIMLPGEDGLVILKRLRSSPATSKLPIIMLTAKSTEYDRVVGLDSGADDYIPKPFGMMELVSRIKSLLRRSGMNEQPDEYAVDGLYVNIPRHTVTTEGKDINLTLKEFELLCFLLKNSGIVLSRDQILTNVWGYDFDGESRTVDVHIRTLRSKLGDKSDIIQTVRGVGYKIGGVS